MVTPPRTFWDDLVEDLQDPEFLRQYVVESLRIETIDRLVNDLDSAREESGMSKAELARAVSAEPAVIRRLLSPGHRNPTIGTLAEVAGALGLRVALVPLSDEEKRHVTEPLRSGRADDVRELAQAMVGKRAHADDGCLT
jgi:DNA-binding phage protein